MIRKVLGIAPTEIEDGAYKPSPLALKLGTSSTTNYENIIYQNPYEKGRVKVLMLCTEEKNMVMANGKKFSTGNHPVEMLVPMMHLEKAGFEIDIFTPTGQSAKIEMWAMPEKDANVKKIYSEYKEKFESPKSLNDFVQNQMVNSNDYIAIFIPGGHGAMLGLPENIALKELLQWSYKKNMLMLSICHGPAALLAANINEESDSFIYKGYSIAAFPDNIDEKAPLIGYLPGSLTWKFGEKLRNLGVNIVNKKADDTCHKDRNLITAASPEAANDFGILAAKELLRRVSQSESK